MAEQRLSDWASRRYGGGRGDGAGGADIEQPRPSLREFAAQRYGGQTPATTPTTPAAETPSSQDTLQSYATSRYSSAAPTTPPTPEREPLQRPGLMGAAAEGIRETIADPVGMAKNQLTTLKEAYTGLLPRAIPEAAPTQSVAPAPTPEQVRTDRASRFLEAAAKGTSKAMQANRERVAADQPLQKLKEQMQQATQPEPEQAQEAEQTATPETIRSGEAEAVAGSMSMMQRPLTDEQQAQLEKPGLLDRTRQFFQNREPDAMANTRLRQMAQMESAGGSLAPTETPSDPSLGVKPDERGMIAAEAMASTVRGPREAPGQLRALLNPAGRSAISAGEFGREMGDEYRALADQNVTPPRELVNVARSPVEFVQMVKNDLVRDPLGQKDPSREQVTAADRLRNMASGLVRGAVSVPAGLLESIAVTAKEIDDLTGGTAYGDQASEELLTYRIGRNLKSIAEAIYPTDERLQGEFISDILPQASGSFGAFIGGGGLTQALRGSATMTSLVAASGLGQSQVYEEARAFGLDEEDARRVAHWGIIPGALQVVPTVRVLDRLNRATNGQLHRSWQRYLAESAKGSMEEFIAESAGQIGFNAIARQTYDENRDYFDGVLEAGGAGAVAGFLASFGAVASGNRSPEVLRRLEEAASELKTAVDNPDAAANIDAAIDEYLQSRARETEQTQHTIEADPDADTLTRRLMEAGLTEQQIAEVTPEQAEAILQDQQTERGAMDATQTETPFTERTDDEVRQQERQVEPQERGVQDAPDAGTDEAGRLPDAEAEVGRQVTDEGPVGDVAVDDAPADAPLEAEPSDVQAQRSVSAYLEGDTVPLQEWLTENDPAYAELDQQFQQAELDGRTDDADALAEQMEDMEIERVTQIAPPESLQRVTQQEDITDATETPVEPGEAAQGVEPQADQTEAEPVTERAEATEPTNTPTEAVNAPKTPAEAIAETDVPDAAPEPQGAQTLVVRQENARQSFVDSVGEQFGLSPEQGHAALDRLMRDRVVKLDPATGQFNLRDGRFWNRDVMLRAAGEQATTPEPEQVTPPAEARIPEGNEQVRVREIGRNMVEVRVDKGVDPELRARLSNHLPSSRGNTYFRGRLTDEARSALNEITEATAPRELSQREQLEAMTGPQLRQMMRERNIPLQGRRKKADFVDAILEDQQQADGGLEAETATEQQAEQDIETGNLLDNPPIPAEPAQGVSGFPLKPQPPSDPVSNDPTIMESGVDPSRMLNVQPVDPQAASKPVSAPEVITSLQAVVQAAGREVPIRIGRFNQKALGVFKVGPEVIRLRQANNIPVAAHEVAHALEKAVYGFPEGGPWVEPRANTTIQRELDKLGRALYGDRKPAGGYKREGFAEFVRMWVTQPDTAQSEAPNFHKWFEESFLNELPEVRKSLENARTLARRWDEQGAVARARATVVDTARPGERFRRFVSGARESISRRGFIDMGAPIDDAAREAERLSGRKLKPSEDPFYIYTALRTTAPARVKYMVEDRMIDLAGNPVGPSLQEAASIVKGKRKDFLLYLYAKRAEALLTDPKGPRDPGMTLEDAQEVIAQLENPQFQLAAQKVYDWNQGVLNYVGQASPTFAEAVKNIRERDPGNYVPLSREMEEIGQNYAQATRKGQGGSPMSRLRGSGRRVKDPIQSMITNAERMIGAAHKRMVLDAMIRLSRQEGMGHIIEEVPVDQVPGATKSIGQLIEQMNREMAKRGRDSEVTLEGELNAAADLVTMFVPAQQPKGQDPIIPMRDGDGKLRWYQFDESLYRTLAGMDLYRLGFWGELFLGKPASLFRAGTTGIRASFGLVTNPTRDFQTLYMNSQASANGGQLLKSWVGSLMDAATYEISGKTSAEFDTFRRLGGEMARMLNQDMANTRRLSRQIFEGRTVRTIDPRNWFDAYRNFVQLPESASRVAELKRVSRDIGWKTGEPMTLDQSLHLLRAAKEVTTDFAAAGEHARAWNRAVPFFNAGIQGPRAAVRAMKRNPSKYVFRGMQLAAATLLLWWTHKDEDWWKEMPAKERFLYWHIPVGDDTLIRIPRAFEVGAFFAALPEALADSWYNSNPDEMKEWFANVLDTMIPGVEQYPVGERRVPGPELPVLAREAASQLANRDFFFDSPIVPMGEQYQPEPEQYNEYTTRASIFLGDLFNASPRRIDHAIRGVGGPVAIDLLDVTGLGRSFSSNDDDPANTPIIGRLFQRGGKMPSRLRSVNKLYESLDEARRIQQSKTQEETPEQRQRRLMMSDAIKAISALSFVRRNTESAEQKRELHLKIMEIAREALSEGEKDHVNRASMRAMQRQATQMREMTERAQQ